MGVQGPLHPDYIGRSKESPLIKELMSLPHHFKPIPNGVELGCSWIDMNTAASLLSRSAYWGNSLREVLSCIVGAEYPPAKLGGVIRKISPSGKVFVIYIIHGDSQHLRTLRWYEFNGMLYSPFPRERNKVLQELVDHYLQAKQKAQQMKGSVHGGEQIKRAV